MDKHTPIALFVYNRPEHTKNTIQALLANPEAASSELFIFSDAAQSDAAKNSVEEVRQLIYEISGFKEITIIEREVNWGLANSVIDGVSHLCDVYGRVIVLEDDLVVSPHFLSYMNNALKQYEDEDRVMQIAGYMFPARLSLESDALFLPFISSWGWATWSRAWKKFDPNAANYQKLKSDNKKKNEFNLGGRYDYFRMLRSQQEGKTNSWAIRWYLSVFYSKGLTLYPKQTLVENSGFDGSGENCIVSDIKTSPIDMAFKVEKFPDRVEVSPYLENVLNALPQPKPKIDLIFSYIKRVLLNLR